MVEEKIEYTLGDYINKCLNGMNNEQRNGHYDLVKGYLKDFLKPIDIDSEIGKELASELERMKAIGKKNHDEYNKKFANLGFLEQGEGRWEGHALIDRNTVDDFVNVCWNIARKYNLFDKKEFISSYDIAAE